MAREAGITQEQVNAAADGLRAAGAKPTVRAVRERLGNTGSNATVMKLLEIWKAGQVRPAETPITLPAALQRALVDYVGQAVAEGKAALATELAELQQVNADLAGESERQAGAIEALEQDLEACRRDRDAQDGRSLQLEEDLAAARADADAERVAAEGARTELAKAQLRLEAMPRLEADLAAVRAELEKERAGRVAAEQASAVAEARREAEQAARTHVEGELAKAEVRVERGEGYGRDLSDRIHALQGELYKATAAAQAAEAAKQRFEDLLAEGMALQKKTVADYAEAAAARDALRAELATLRREAAPSAAAEKPAGGAKKR